MKKGTAPMSKTNLIKESIKLIQSNRKNKLIGYNTDKITVYGQLQKVDLNIIYQRNDKVYGLVLKHFNIKDYEDIEELYNDLMEYIIILENKTITYYENNVEKINSEF